MDNPSYLDIAMENAPTMATVEDVDDLVEEVLSQPFGKGSLIGYEVKEVLTRLGSFHDQDIDLCTLINIQ